MRRKLLVGVTLVALAVAGIATYSWAASSEGQTINACVNDEGKLRLVTGAAACRKAETPLSWNTVGPPGAQGVAGAQGAQGPAGPAGVPPPSPDAVSGTVGIIGQRQGALSPITLTGISHAIVSPRDAASGQSSGKRQHGDVKIVKEWDKSTPLLFRAAANNETLTSVLIGLLRNGTQVATIKLTNAHVADYAEHGLTESWSFTYQKIEWTWIDGGISFADDWQASAA